MPDLVVAGNWKMNTTIPEAAALAAVSYTHLTLPTSDLV